jgi:hypothetical protein
MTRIDRPSPPELALLRQPKMARLGRLSSPDRRSEAGNALSRRAAA